MKRTKITNKIDYVEPDSMTNFTSCAGIIVQSKKKVMIDVNMGAKETYGLMEEEKPEIAIITHYHLDHSLWARHLNSFSDAVLFIPEHEAQYLTSLDFFMEHTAGPFSIAEKWKDFTINLGYTELKNYECYNEQTTFKDMAPEIVLIETPGHSPSHTSFYFPDEKILFSGDMGLDQFGPWYGWTDCNIKQIAESILRLDGLAVNLILTSHGGVRKKEIQKEWVKCIHHLWQREENIILKLEAGMTKKDIIRQGVFFSDKEKVKEPMQSFLKAWDTTMYNHHENLIKEGGLMKFFPEIKAMLKLS